MDNIVYLISLFDYYGDLLTDKQKEYFKDYYFRNLSLSEISENSHVSRHAVYKGLKETVNKLEVYERKLELYKKGKKIKNLISHLDNDLIEKINKLI